MNTPTTQLQTSPYLREQRQFPPENLQELARQTDQAYIDIANKVNSRTIGIYAVNFPIITGEQWYLQGQPQKQQTLRQVYTFVGNVGAFPTSIPIALQVGQISFLTMLYGQYTDGSNWFGLTPGNNRPIAGQVSIWVNQNNINFTVGAGAPTVTKGLVVLEWLSMF